MRSFRARWATCALAISICVPALADRHKSLGECTAFDQNNKGDDAVEFTIHNSCKLPIECGIQWRVVCAPESKKRRNVHLDSAKLSLLEGKVDSASASASICGDDAWSIDQVTWGCQPAP